MTTPAPTGTDRDDTEWLRLVNEIRTTTGWPIEECQQAAETIISDFEGEALA